MKNKSLTSSLVKTTSLTILGVISVIVLIILIYAWYFLNIVERIYTIDNEFLAPLYRIVIALLILIIITAVIASIISGLTLSKRFLSTIHSFTKEMKEIQEEGIDKRLHVNGDDELAQLGNAFNELMDQVESTMKLQSQFVSDASHELKTPLAIIKGNLDMLQRWGKDDPDILMQSLQNSSEEADRLTALCEELLSFKKIDMDEWNEAIDVSNVLQTTIEEYKNVYPDIKIELAEDDKKLAIIRTEHLKQLCHIFIDNAIKYAKDEKANITIRYHNYSLSIRDEGIGIAEEHLEHIFDRFYKVEESRSDDKKSFGLGLAIAKRICEQYGFTINVESREKEYTKFEILLKEKI